MSKKLQVKFHQVGSFVPWGDGKLGPTHRCRTEFLEI